MAEGEASLRPLRSGLYRRGHPLVGALVGALVGHALPDALLR